jgi:F-type H+-transporting ATPase subunit b
MFESFIGVNFWTALFVLLNTLAIYFVAKRLLFKPVHKIITDRQAEIDGMYSDATRAKTEAEQMARDYRQKLRDAQQTSERLMKEAAERGLKREVEIVKNAREQAEAILSRASEDAINEKKKALTSAKDEISSIAMAMAEKVIERELTEEDQAKMVDNFINELGDEA